jgi:hypothetical protein
MELEVKYGPASLLSSHHIGDGAADERRFADRDRVEGRLPERLLRNEAEACQRVRLVGASIRPCDVLEKSAHSVPTVS